VRVLFVADVIGSPGRRVLTQLFKLVKEETRADFVIVNGENSAGGFGITP
jgi:2',3'-cyclic-nucleotide 2'-phosphodiesterase